MDDERVREGVEHLQRAAKEMIDAARAFLDVADRLVEDPGSVRSLADLLARVARSTTAAPRRADTGDDGPTLERISVS